jgi:PAS domain S-box-containing protein
VVTWSDELYRIFGLPADQFGGLYLSFIGCVHPDDRPIVLEANRTAREAGTSFQLDYRIVRAGGEEWIIREVGHSFRDPSGEVTRLFGVAQDVTDWEQRSPNRRPWLADDSLRDVA